MERCKKRYMERLSSTVFEQEEFRMVGRASGLNMRLGTHSLRKYPATFARSNCCTIDEIDVRGRWKRNTKRVSDRYIDVEQPWIDGKVASALCPGGPVKYELAAGSGVTRDWLMSFVVPGISTFYGDNNSISDVLSLPLLWACLDVQYSSRLPAWLTTRVRIAYDVIKVLPDANPVKKVLLVVYNVQGQLAIQTAVDGIGTGGNNDGNNNINNNDQINALLLQQQQIHARLGEMSDALTASVSQGIKNLKQEIESRLKIFNNNVNRLFIQPTRRIENNNNNNINNNNINNNNNNNNAGEVLEEEVGGRALGGPLADLSSSPKSLHDLWLEYTVGLEGRKLARDFNAVERGEKRVKYRYCRRKVFWDCVSKHVNAGYAVDTVFNRIRECYGHSLSVYDILIRMAKDRRERGGHPNLRI